MVDPVLLGNATSRKFVSPKVRLLSEFLVNAFRMGAWPA
jgi:hypothetical protein